MPKDSKKYAILLSLLCSSLFVSLIAQDRHPSYSEVTSLDSTTSKDSATLLSNKPITLLDSISKDSLQSDSLGVDSLANDSVSPKKKKAGLTSVVDYKANDSIVFTHGNEVYMYGKGVVQFDGMELNADQIEMNMDSSLVYAVGRPDSVGDIVGRPSSIKVTAWRWQALSQRRQRTQSAALYMTTGRRRCDSGLLHHQHDKGQPLRKTMVRIPGPSFREKRWISKMSPSA